MKGLLQQVLDNGNDIEYQIASEIDNFFLGLSRYNTPYDYNYLFGYNKRRTKDYERYMRLAMKCPKPIDIFILKYDRNIRRKNR